jgi:hypothetical protein
MLTKALEETAAIAEFAGMPETGYGMCGVRCPNEISDQSASLE